MYLSEANVNYKISVYPEVGHDMQTYSTLVGMKWDFPKNYWVWRKRADNNYSTIIDWIREL